MCGIVGLWQKNNVISCRLLETMRDSLYNRGPDDFGLWIDKNVGLGHRRLSIIDLSPLGRQPMIDDETGNVIVFNGEVYNFQQIRKILEQEGYKFKSNTDTEVILKAFSAWGENCVSRFVGMFAFAIWEPKQQRFFLARDRLGIKPLYYFYDPNLFLFASRLCALIRHPDCPRRIDIEALGLYLEVGFVPAPWSIWCGVRKLRPGHILIVDKNGISEKCYWDLDKLKIDLSTLQLSEEELIDRLEQLLFNSIRLQLISDVPLGAFLSGGIDSSLVVSIMSKLTDRPPKTFTIGFQEKEYDESLYAKKVAEYLGTEHYQQIMSVTDLIALLEEHTVQYDEPFADWSSLPTMLVSRFARRYVTVCLSGDGGDELFAGYHYYPIISSLRPIFQFPQLLRLIPGEILVKFGNHSLTLLGEAIKKSNIISCFAFMRSMIKDFDRNSIFEAESLTLAELFEQRSEKFSWLDPVSKVCRLDLAYYLPDDILQKVDVASMAYGLEARVPILDHRIVEFSQSLPRELKLRNRRTKYLLKKVLARHLPETLIERPKKGFCVPLDKWFRNELKPMLLDELSDTKIKKIGLLNPVGVKQLIDLHLSEKRDTHPMLWVIFSLVRWHSVVTRQINSV